MMPVFALPSPEQVAKFLAYLALLAVLHALSYAIVWVLRAKLWSRDESACVLSALAFALYQPLWILVILWTARTQFDFSDLSFVVTCIVPPTAVQFWVTASVFRTEWKWVTIGFALAAWVGVTVLARDFLRGGMRDSAALWLGVTHSALVIAGYRLSLKESGKERRWPRSFWFAGWSAYVILLIVLRQLFV